MYTLMMIFYIYIYLVCMRFGQFQCNLQIRVFLFSIYFSGDELGILSLSWPKLAILYELMSIRVKVCGFLPCGVLSSECW